MKLQGSQQNNQIGKSNQHFQNRKNRSKIQLTINKISHIGLPNIGNTCFLNSALQFLYSAEHFRNALIEHYRKSPNSFNKRAALIAKIFIFMTENDAIRNNRAQIKQMLEELARQLQLVNLNYKVYQQQDAFQTLLNLLFEIDNEEQFPLKYYFQIQTQSRCQCPPFELSIKSQFFCRNQQTKCNLCKQPFTQIYHQLPKYLIMVNNRNQEYLAQYPYYMINHYEQTIKKYSKQQLNQIQVELLSIMKYRGNKKSGHYKCVRKIDDTYYCFDDDKVTKIEQNLEIKSEGCFPCRRWFCSKEISRVLLIENKSKPLYVQKCLNYPQSSPDYSKSSQSSQRRRTEI